MGSGASSLPETIDEPTARALAGERFDDAAFQRLATNGKRVYFDITCLSLILYQADLCAHPCSNTSNGAVALFAFLGILAEKAFLQCAMNQSLGSDSMYSSVSIQ